jgi:hypothetical protein
MSEDLKEQLHGFADWLERNNNVHAFSVPRRAAITIERLEKENQEFRLLLNKQDLTLLERVNRYIGLTKYLVYKAWKKI